MKLSNVKTRPPVVDDVTTIVIGQAALKAGDAENFTQIHLSQSGLELFLKSKLTTMNQSNVKRILMP